MISNYEQQWLYYIVLILLITGLAAAYGLISFIVTKSGKDSLHSMKTSSHNEDSATDN